VHSSVWVASATTAFDPSVLPVRRCAKDKKGMITSDAAARAMPTGEASGWCPPTRARVDSTVT